MVSGNKASAEFYLAHVFYVWIFFLFVFSFCSSRIRLNLVPVPLLPQVRLPGCEWDADVSLWCCLPGRVGGG